MKMYLLDSWAANIDQVIVIVPDHVTDQQVLADEAIRSQLDDQPRIMTKIEDLDDDEAFSGWRTYVG